MRNFGKILVIRGGAIGDFILTLPVLAALRRQFPLCQLEVLGYSHIASLAKAGGLVDAVRSIEARSLAGFFARGGDLSEDLVDYFSEFALIISFLYDPDEIFQINVRRCSSAQYLAGPHRPDESLALHATECLLKPLERLAIFECDPVPSLSLQSPPSRSSPWIALHPGSGSERKNWPEDKWLQLLLRLARETNACFLLVGGEAEGDRLDRLAQSLPPERSEWARNKPLPELGGLLSQVNVFVGHDSGISHLAAAVSLPSVILWGHTSPEIWRPLGTNIRLLRYANGLNALPMELVFDEILSMLD